MSAPGGSVISRESLLALLIEASQELAARHLSFADESYLEPASNWCAFCQMFALGSQPVVHLPSCLVGRVLGLIAELQGPILQQPIPIPLKCTHCGKPLERDGPFQFHITLADFIECYGGRSKPVESRPIPSHPKLSGDKCVHCGMSKYRWSVFKCISSGGHFVEPVGSHPIPKVVGLEPFRETYSVELDPVAHPTPEELA